MRILHVGHSDSKGGAARAAMRIHRALLESGVDSTMLVVHKGTDEPEVMACPPTGWKRLTTLAWKPLLRLYKFYHQRWHSIFASFNLSGTSLADRIDALKPDIVHLQWVGRNAISLAEIARIRQPIVWTLHDMWPLCGAMHYDDDVPEAIWRSGGGSGFPAWKDLLEKHIWSVKHRAWKNSMFRFVTPSTWLADCVRRSKAFSGKTATVIPYPLDLDMFRPEPPDAARRELGLPDARPIIVFGAVGGAQDPRKGWSILVEALGGLPADVLQRNPLCCVFGQAEPRNAGELPLETRWMGRIDDDRRMRLLYSAADVTVVPSRLEALGQTGTEAQACGCPVVTFSATGTRDIVEHEQTGYLVDSMAPEALAEGIAWVIRESQGSTDLRTRSRSRAERLWSPKVVAALYGEVYADCLAGRVV